MGVPTLGVIPCKGVTPIYRVYIKFPHTLKLAEIPMKNIGKIFGGKFFWGNFIDKLTAYIFMKNLTDLDSDDFRFNTSVFS